MAARYFKNGGIETDSSNPPVSYTYGHAEIGRSDEVGMCGYGSVSKDGEAIEQMTTRVGAAPSNCPSPPGGF